MTPEEDLTVRINELGVEIRILQTRQGELEDQLKAAVRARTPDNIVDILKKLEAEDKWQADQFGEGQYIEASLVPDIIAAWLNENDPIDVLGYTYSLTPRGNLKRRKVTTVGGT